MAKLYFRYGTMDSSKTANALMVRYNYLEKGQNPIILKPKIENRDGEKTIRSRIGISAECDYVEDLLEKAENEWFTGKSDDYKKIDCLIVDEAQFLSAKQVDMFARIVDELNVPVVCYGLRTDFTGHLFEGSQCGKKAVFNARVKDGKMVRTGEQIMMGGNESYITVCRKHFFKGQLYPPSED